MRSFLYLPLALAAAGCAATAPSPAMERRAALAQSQLDAKLAGYTAGAVQECLDTRTLEGPEGYGDSTLLFRDGRRRLYRTETSGSCNGIGRGDALITRQYGTRICRGDIARTADLTAGIPTGSCSFGAFVPYTRAR